MLGAIAGSIAEAFYRDIPDEILAGVRERLPGEYRRLVAAFYARFGIPEIAAKVRGWE
jgi:hypothetical protein